MYVCLQCILRFVENTFSHDFFKRKTFEIFTISTSAETLNLRSGPAAVHALRRDAPHLVHGREPLRPRVPRGGQLEHRGPAARDGAAAERMHGPLRHT